MRIAWRSRARSKAGLFVIILFSLILMGPILPHASGGTRADDVAGWTVIVYMSGDSSLSDNIVDDLEEMKTVGSGGGLEIIALADRSGVGDSNVYHVLEGGSEKIPMEEIDPSWGDELNMGDPETLSTFIKWAASTYPAEHYLLDLWGHGNGWTGVCPDKGDRLSAVELKEALAATSATVDIDIVSMDACQMGMLEMFYQIRENAEYAIGSEKDVPLAGWPYDRILNILKDDPDIQPKDFGERFIDNYITWSMANSAYSTTLSLIDLGQLGPVAEALDSYAMELGSSVGYFHPEIYSARGMTEEYDGADQYDLVHLTQMMDNTSASLRFKESGEGLRLAIENAVTYERHWTRPNEGDEPADNANGMSIWFPISGTISDYKELDIAEDTAWDEFLDTGSDHWYLDEREEIEFKAEAMSVDTDSDGLNDDIQFIVQKGDYSYYKVDVYDDDWELVQSFSEGVPDVSDTHIWSPPSAGTYAVAFYCWQDDGTLLNYSLVNKGINSELRYIISGQVLSEAGKKMRQVRVTAMDSENNTLADAVTDADGRFEIIMIAPWETDGNNITLVCELGIYSKNISLQTLEPVNNVRIEVEDGPRFTLPVLYLGIISNIIGFLLIAYIVFRNNKGGDLEEEEQSLPPGSAQVENLDEHMEIDKGQKEELSIIDNIHKDI